MIEKERVTIIGTYKFCKTHKQKFSRSIIDEIEIRGWPCAVSNCPKDATHSCTKETVYRLNCGRRGFSKRIEKLVPQIEKMLKANMTYKQIRDEFQISNYVIVLVKNKLKKEEHV